MEEEKKNLEIEPLYDDGRLVGVKDFDLIRARLVKYLETNKTFEILNNEDKKKAKEIRADLNAVCNDISRYRIDTEKEIFETFESQCKELEKMLKDRADEFGVEINKYVASTKPIVEKEKLTIVSLKFIGEDKELLDKIITFANRNHLKYAIREE